jgi:hypothetical protein
MACEELKNDLATILDVRVENLVETLTVLLSKLNGTGVEMDEETDAVEERSRSISAAAVAAAVTAAAVSATAVLAAVEAAVVSASAAAAAVTASSLLQPPPPVIYTTRTRPKLLEMVELDKDAFKVLDKYGKPRSDAAARMCKCRAVNEFVNTILGDYF